MRGVCNFVLLVFAAFNYSYVLAVEWLPAASITVESNSVGMIIVENSIVSSTIRLEQDNGNTVTQSTPNDYGVAAVLYVELGEKPASFEIYQKHSHLTVLKQTPQVRYVELDARGAEKVAKLSKALQDWQHDSFPSMEKFIDEIESVALDLDMVELADLIVFEAYLHMQIRLDKSRAVLETIETFFTGFELSNQNHDIKLLAAKIAVVQGLALINESDPGLAGKGLRLVSNKLLPFSDSNSALRMYLMLFDSYQAFFRVLNEHLAGTKGQSGQAILALTELARHAEEIDAIPILATSNSLLAQAHWFAGDLSVGLELFEKAVASYEDLGDPNDIATAYNNIANLYIDAGMLDRALIVLSDGVKITNDLPTVSIRSFLFSNLADVYHKVGDHSLSLINAQRAARVEREGGLKYAEALSMKQVARAFRNLKNFDGAIDANLKAINYFRRNSGESENYTLAIEVIELELVSIYLDRGNKADLNEIRQLIGKEQCDSYGGSIDNKLVKSKLPASFVKYNLVKAHYFIASGVFSDALSCLDKLATYLVSDVQTSYPEAKIEASILKIRAFTGLGNLVRAREEINVLVDETDRVRELLDARFLSQAVSVWLRRGLTPYLNAVLDNHLTTKDLALADDVFELLESSSYLSLKNARSNLKNDSFNSGIRKSELDVVSKAEIELLNAKRDVQNNTAINKTLDAYQYISSQRIKNKDHETSEHKTLSILEVQSKLTASEALLRYYVLPDAVVVFYVSASSFEVRKVKVKERVLTELVSKIWESFASQSREYTDDIAVLSEVLSFNHFKLGRYKKLIILPDGPLELVPFAALSFHKKPSVKKLAANYVEVTRTYSIIDYFSEYSGFPENDDYFHDVVVFADPAFNVNDANSSFSDYGSTGYRDWSSSNARLKGSGEEAKSIASTFSDMNVKLHVREQATRTAFFSPQTRQAKLFHIASHGYYEPEAPFLVGIAVSKESESDSGLVSLAQIQSSLFSSNLVVISGCETTLGVAYSGEGLNGLSTGFLAQGASSVIGTLWSIPDKPTAEFMKIFYSELKLNGGNASQALATAKKSFSRDGRYRHPFFWASFSLASASQLIERNVFR